mmetsp:Transcript_32884/g.90826  ORF Transcript_32884/g.90826 Transcript_32884/m.90826 type:complete len:270 (+) Transcript_32884:658-1467(+)
MSHSRCTVGDSPFAHEQRLSRPSRLSETRGGVHGAPASPPRGGGVSWPLSHTGGRSATRSSRACLFCGSSRSTARRSVVAAASSPSLWFARARRKSAFAFDESVSSAASAAAEASAQRSCRRKHSALLACTLPVSSSTCADPLSGQVWKPWRVLWYLARAASSSPAPNFALPCDFASRASSSCALVGDESRRKLSSRGSLATRLLTASLPCLPRANPSRQRMWQSALSSPAFDLSSSRSPCSSAQLQTTFSGKSPCSSRRASKASRCME